MDRWLVGKAKVLSARTVRLLHSCLNRAVKFAQARDKVKRNVVGLCEIPEGKEGRPSKSLTLGQATELLDAAEGTRLYAYVVLSLLIGARTEELRALTWKEVDLVGDPDKDIPPWIAVWRSVREGGDTKTKRSRRSLALPMRCVEALKTHREQQRKDKKAAGDKWQDHGLVFASSRCSPTLASPWRTSPVWSATAGGRSPKPSTASRSAPYLCRERRRWTPSSPGSHSVSHSPMRKGAILVDDTLLDQRNLVGTTGFEPATP
ncbi:hypothetical protein [Nonomuraea jabiensis]|uniref:hypothetical protein n=1 Tax=Nonomuraea jabiensis TaxID=882448 RepID=UPI00367A7F62